MINVKFYSKAAMLAGSLLAMLALSPTAKAVPLIIGERAGQLTSTRITGPVDLITFDATNGSGDCVAAAGLSITSGNITRANIRNVTLNPTGTCYLSVNRDRSIVLNFRSAIQQFGFFWGSIDVFNSVNFNLNGRTVLSLTGTDAVRELQLTEGFINILFPAREGVSQIVFNTTSPAFEIDNITIGLRVLDPPPVVRDPVAENDPIYIPYPPRIPPRDPGFTGLGASFNIEPVSFDLDAQATSVSEPASLALFGAGLAGVGLMAGRRNRIKAA